MIDQPVFPTSNSNSFTVNIADVILIVNSDGVIRFATPTITESYGYLLDEVIGQSILHFIVPEDNNAIIHYWSAIVHDPTFESNEIISTAITANQRQVPVQVSIWRMPQDEFLLVIHALDRLVNQDTAALYAGEGTNKNPQIVEEQLTIMELVLLLRRAHERTEQLTAANEQLKMQGALRKDLTYQISHDLRSPLQIVYGYTDMLIRSELGTISEEQEAVMGQVIKKIKMIERLTKDILATEPISHDHLDLSVVDINQMSQQAIDDAAMVYNQQNSQPALRFVTELVEGELLVNIDYNRLSRVFANIINNAIKFSLNGGTITLSTAYNSDKTQVLISITDQGIGIPDSKQPLIFEQFFRGNKMRFEGTGLGLYIVQQIVEAHQGRVWVTSKVGEGSTFGFALPLVAS